MGADQLTRVQKVIRDAGLCSRRTAEQWIEAGRIRVNGEVVTRPGTVVNPAKDVIEVDGVRIPTEQHASSDAYVMLHKPENVLTTMDDPDGRTTVMDIIGERDVRIHPVGRLDYKSEGLLILTNDGELTHRLTHPSFEVIKTYRVLVARHPDDDDLRVLSKGMMLSDGPTYPAKVRRIGRRRDGHWIEISIHEGRNRQVRRMLAAVGHDVLRLIRVQIGPLRLNNLTCGHDRDLTDEEVARLKEAVGLN